MQTTIEDWFFSYFEEKGLVSKCINLVSYKYDLGEIPHNIPIEEIKFNVEDLKSIKKDLYKLGQISLDYKKSILMDEVSQNINSCDGQELDDYIFSLLKPFKELSELINPIGKLEKMKLEYMEAIQNDSDVNIINKLSDRIARVQAAQKIYRGMDIFSTNEEPESTLSCLFFKQQVFFDSLDAILLPLHIDIFNYQKEIGIYLSTERNVGLLICRLGGYDLINYIDELDHRKPHQRSTPEFIISPRLDTKEMKNIFKKGIELGLMEVSEQGHYKWLSTNVLFSYFVDIVNQKIFNKGNRAHRDVKPFAELFEWESRKITQGMQEYKKIGKYPEKYEQIDSLF